MDKLQENPNIENPVASEGEQLQQPEPAPVTEAAEAKTRKSRNKEPVVDYGLVEVVKFNESPMHIHPDAVADHERLGWKPKDL